MAALTSFYDWLTKQNKQRTPIGDFAREAKRDPAFPKDVATLDALITYWQATPSRSPQSVAAARAAYRAYERANAPAVRG